MTQPPCPSFQKNLLWLVELKRHPGWADYADWKAKKMDEGQSGLFKGIANELKRMTK